MRATEQGWFLVETLGTSTRVLMVDSRHKQWRPISNQFRGTSFSAIQVLLSTVMDNLKSSQTTIDDGHTLVLAEPVIGPERIVQGILMWIGPGNTPVPVPPEAWAFRLKDSPDAATDSPRFIQDPRYPTPFSTHDKQMGTLCDLLSQCSGLESIVSTLGAVEKTRMHTEQDAQGEWITHSGEIYRYIFIRDGSTLKGLAVRLDETIPESNEPLLSTKALTFTAGVSDTYLAITGKSQDSVQAWG